MSAATSKETMTMSTQKRALGLGTTRLALATALLAFGAWLLAPPPASAAEAGPAWKLAVHTAPTNLSSETISAFENANGELFLTAINVGGAPTTSEPIVVTDTLGAGITPLVNGPLSTNPACAVSGQTVTCTFSETVHSGHELNAPSAILGVRIDLEVSPSAEGSVLNEASVSGGGASATSLTTPLTISKSPTIFGFLPGDDGFSAPITGADGAADTQAGSHPHQMTIDLGFSEIASPGGFVTSEDPLRDVTVDLPRGTVVNPRATPTLCTESQFEASSGGSVSCPDSSQVGAITVLVGVLGITAYPAPVYNMVPPPGTPSMFGFQVGGVALFFHITGAVRSDGDYGLSGSTNDVLARALNPTFGNRLALWGDPADPSHDYARGDDCLHSAGECPLAADEPGDAFLTMPVECSGQPSVFGARADSWKHPNDFKTASYESADLAGNPGISGRL